MKKQTRFDHFSDGWQEEPSLNRRPSRHSRGSWISSSRSGAIPCCVTERPKPQSHLRKRSKTPRNTSSVRRRSRRHWRQGGPWATSSAFKRKSASYPSLTMVRADALAPADLHSLWRTRLIELVRSECKANASLQSTTQLELHRSRLHALRQQLLKAGLTDLAEETDTAEQELEQQATSLRTREQEDHLIATIQAISAKTPCRHSKGSECSSTRWVLCRQGQKLHEGRRATPSIVRSHLLRHMRTASRQSWVVLIAAMQYNHGERNCFECTVAMRERLIKRSSTNSTDKRG